MRLSEFPKSPAKATLTLRHDFRIGSSVPHEGASSAAYLSRGVLHVFEKLHPLTEGHISRKVHLTDGNPIRLSQYL